VSKCREIHEQRRWKEIKHIKLRDKDRRKEEREVKRQKERNKHVQAALTDKLSLEANKHIC
jgi:hypothetical protein